MSPLPPPEISTDRRDAANGSPARPLIVSSHREVAYEDALARQEAAVRRLKEEPNESERLFLVEHTPVVTLGRSGDGRYLRVSRETLAARGVAFRSIRRGGDVTYHGPGQWTLYPVVRLDRLGKDLHRYMRMLEECAIRFLAACGVAGRRVPGRTGVWVDADGSAPRKIAAIGVAVTRWIAYHGMAVNIRPDLAPFRDWIVPCGISPEEGGVTSLAELTGDACDMDEAGRRLVRAFCEVFPFDPRT